MTAQDIAYYSMRARKERESAARCDDTSARRVHLEMAARYLAKVDMLGDQPIVKLV
jgi:hypothetical protein